MFNVYRIAANEAIFNLVTLTIRQNANIIIVSK